MTKHTKIFLDTEFTGLHQHTTLISLALVAETGEEFYAEFNDYDEGQVNEWLKVHVLSQLQFKHISEVIEWKGKNCHMKGSKHQVKNMLEDFLSYFNKIEIWGDNHAYDWVLFCQIWDGAQHLPKLKASPTEPQIDYLIRDLVTLFQAKNKNPSASRQEFAAWLDNQEFIQHHALWDARVVKQCYLNLMTN